MEGELFRALPQWSTKALHMNRAWYIPVTEGLRQEDHEFEITTDY